MKLIYKFFLAFFVTNVTIVSVLLILIVFSLSSGFNDFVSEAENEHVESSKEQLIATYRQNNNWRVIENNVQIWRDIVDPQPNPRPPPPPRDFNPKKRPGSEPVNPNRRLQPPPRNDNPADFLKTGRRLSLYDRNKVVIVGKTNLSENPRKEPILMDGEIIGWLGLVPSNAIKDSPASEFLAQQYKIYYIIAGAAIFIALLMALMLSKHLMSPIKRLIEGTNGLIEGNYGSRVKKVTQDELGLLSDNVNELANTLEKNQKNRFQWMSDTSHELRTPLTVLKSQLMAIQDGIFPANDQRISLFIDEIDNLNKIVDDLYQLSSSDAGGLTYKKILHNPLETFIAVVESFLPKFEQNTLTVDYHSLQKMNADCHCHVLADKDRLRQLLTNLLENSCRYTLAGGKVRITATMDDQNIEIRVEDSTPGVAQELQGKLFDRFYRVEQSRSRSHGGSGLGLALCKSIVEAHQGTITASNSSLGGLCLTVKLPLH